MEIEEMKVIEKENESLSASADTANVSVNVPLDAPQNGLNKESTIAEIVENDPTMAGKLKSAGLGCSGCPMSQFETFEQGARGHGLDPDKLLAQLNAMDDDDSYEEYD